MAELYIRCTRAILTKMSRVLSEPEDSPSSAHNRAMEDNMSERVKILSVLLKEQDNTHVDTVVLPRLPNHLYRLFSKEHSRFGFACHLFLEENRKLDTARFVDPAPAPSWENAALLLKFHVVHPSPSADVTFHRKFVSDQLRELGLIERVNLKAGCVSSSSPPVNAVKPAPPPIPAKPWRVDQTALDAGTEGLDNPEFEERDLTDNHEDNYDDDDEYSNLVILTAHQYGLDLVSDRGLPSLQKFKITSYGIFIPKV